MIHNNAKAKLAFQNAYDLNPVNLGVLAFLQLTYVNDLVEDSSLLIPMEKITSEGSRLISLWRDSAFILLHIVGHMNLHTHLTWISERHAPIGAMTSVLIARFQPSRNLIDLASKIKSGRFTKKESKSELIMNTARIYEMEGMPREDAIRKVKQSIVEAVDKGL